jgi:phage terminase large subunit GpA-like protein
MRSAVSEAIGRWRPPPALTTSQWADAKRRISEGTSPEPGRWRTARVPYLGAIMDTATDPDVEQAVLMKSGQIAGTEALLNVIGHFIENQPSPMMLVMPTLDMADDLSRDRLATMIRDSPSLRGLVKDPRTRDSGNTLRHKAFPGGHLTLAGANSPASLSSRPLRVVLFDEVDRFPPSAGTEGDPIDLGIKRTNNFWNRFVLMVSTPGTKGASRIEIAFEESDQRHYYVPCHRCGTFQVLVWAQLKWRDDRPETAYYECPHCGAPWSDGHKLAALAPGEWRAHRPERRVPGFHLWEAYSPWVPFAKLVKGYLNARPFPERYKTWVNTSLGETYEEEGQQGDRTTLLARREFYGAAVPAAVLALFAGLDVQDDRIEISVWGVGEGEALWAIAHDVLYGDPSRGELWNRARALLERRFEREGGDQLVISAVGVDTGHCTDQAYAFCKRYRYYALKGLGGQGKPIASRPSRRNKARVALYSVGVDAAKRLLIGRLQVGEPGPGFIHLPMAPWCHAEWIEQLTAEKLVLRYRKGYPIYEWVKVRPRNEALDCLVYAYAAFCIRRPVLSQLEKGVPSAAAPGKVSGAPASPPKPWTPPVTVADNPWLA